MYFSISRVLALYTLHTLLGVHCWAYTPGLLGVRKDLRITELDRIERLLNCTMPRCWAPSSNMGATIAKMYPGQRMTR
jgi:hypothetical protein